MFKKQLSSDYVFYVSVGLKTKFLAYIFLTVWTKCLTKIKINP